jgi:hypothetical protein
MERPMPRLDPVTTATFPVSAKGFVIGSLSSGPLDPQFWGAPAERVSQADPVLSGGALVLRDARSRGLLSMRAMGVRRQADLQCLFHLLPSS